MAFCWHHYQYIGMAEANQWVGGVTGGILRDVLVPAKKCTKCGKVKAI